MKQFALAIVMSAVMAASTVACGGNTEQQSPAGTASNPDRPSGEAAGSNEQQPLAGAMNNMNRPVGEGAKHTDTHGALAVATITLKSDPDPPKTGENHFEVTVMDHEKQPVTDAEVWAEFYMPAMPSMNMPEIRQRIPLKQAAGGTYVGLGTLTKAGAWDVGVSVRRAGTEIAGTKFKITAQ